MRRKHNGTLNSGVGLLCLKHLKTLLILVKQQSPLAMKRLDVLGSLLHIVTGGIVVPVRSFHLVLTVIDHVVQKRLLGHHHHMISLLQKWLQFVMKHHLLIQVKLLLPYMANLGTVIHSVMILKCLEVMTEYHPP